MAAKNIILHLIPSGILRRGKICVIGNGVVIDPIALVGEIEGLRKARTQDRQEPADQRLRASRAAVSPRARRTARVAQRVTPKIGTTKRGIGPAYGDKAARTGLRIVRLDAARAVFKKAAGQDPGEQQHPASARRHADFFRQGERDYPRGGRAAAAVRSEHRCLSAPALQQGKEILFEGAQGTFLDIDHGTYPYVTSSNTTAGGACTGTGVPPHRMDRVLGVMKAYTTRVGEGALPTEDAGSRKCCTRWGGSLARPPGGRAAAAGSTLSRLVMPR